LKKYDAKFRENIHKHWGGGKGLLHRTKKE
jgi:hypothetical protein